MRHPIRIVLTGGPGGGKTTLIREIFENPAFRDQFAALPEAIFCMKDVGISSTEKLFQRIVVNLQFSLEDGLCRGLGYDNRRILLCHRGSLDPLAYWLDRGWDEDQFFEYTETTPEDHYPRYVAVIHLVTSADGAEHAYKRWPEAHRGEDLEHAVRLDRFLFHVWRKHPNYYRIDNHGKDWKAKSSEVHSILKVILQHGSGGSNASIRL